MGKKLNNAPVYYTVAQVQFNPILNLESYIPAIQAKMREARFPDFKQETIQRLVLPFGNAEQGAQALPALSQQSRYLFGDMQGRSLFLLEPNSMSLQTTAYDTFEIFSKTLLTGMGVVHEALRLDFVERIGLRYLDAVLPREGETLKNYLVPEVLGLSLRGEGRLQHSISETMVTNSAGQLVSRAVIREGRVGLPVELGAPSPTIDARFTQREGTHAILDTDASIIHREIFDLQKIGVRLIALHDQISMAFRATITDHALSVWS